MIDLFVFLHRGGGSGVVLSTNRSSFTHFCFMATQMLRLKYFLCPSGQGVVIKRLECQVWLRQICVCFNVSVACNHEKGTSMEIRSRERGEELWSGEGGEEGGGKKNTLSFHCVPSNSFLVIIEIDVCCGAVNLQDLLLIKRQRQPSR